VSSNLDDLGAAFRAAIEKINEAQSSAGVTRDRGDEALHLLASVSDGTASTLIQAAIERVAAADAALDEVLGMYVGANEQIETYLGHKGI
jgi:hypothetical protein